MPFPPVYLCTCRLLSIYTLYIYLIHTYLYFTVKLLPLVKAYDKICKNVFLQHASTTEAEGHLPQTSIPDVFESLKIPGQHVNIFETVLRKETNFKRKPEKTLGFPHQDYTSFFSFFFGKLLAKFCNLFASVQCSCEFGRSTLGGKTQAQGSHTIFSIKSSSKFSDAFGTPFAFAFREAAAECGGL